MNKVVHKFLIVFVKTIQILTLLCCAPLFATPPPENSLIELKTKTRTFNHLYDYAIENAVIWYRPRNDQTAQWRVIPFDNYDSEIPIEIQADGANLMVLDNYNEIHYKKVIEEWRDDYYNYHFTDLNQDYNWYSDWYSFPWVSSVFKSKRLRLPEGVTVWANSQRGQFNAYTEDIRGVPFPPPNLKLISTVTTIFAISPDQKKIIYADPWLPMGFKLYSISVPLTQEGMLIEQLVASASAIFIVGNFYGQKRLFTRLADFDLLRLDPLLPAFYFKNRSVEQEWKEVRPPEFYGLARLDGPITIFQTGMGNASRELRMAGYNPNGKYGFYYKNIEEVDWNFCPAVKSQDDKC